MRKLIITFCLMLLCMIISGSRAYAAFIYDITEFEQFDGADTFTDTFSDGVEPPDGPSGTSTYFVEGAFGSTRESGGLLELNSADGVIDDEDRMIDATLIDSTYFFTKDVGGHVIGKFEANDGFWPRSFFGIGIFNAIPGGGDPATFDEAWMDIYTDDLGIKYAAWGDEGSFGFQDITTDLVGVTDITFKLEISTANLVTAMWDYGSNGTFDLIKSSFTELTFNQTLGVDDIYLGEFYAGEPIPEPATVALLGIGLAGLAGAAVRRRLKKAKQH